jgi:hypothetical protein
MSETEKIDWKTHGVKVIPGDCLDPNTTQTPGMNRAAPVVATSQPGERSMSLSLT